MNEFFIYLDIQTLTEYQKSIGILNIIFVFIDLVFVFFSATRFRAVDQNVKLLRSKLFNILFVDIFIRIFHIYIFNLFDVKLLYEIITNSTATLQFYLILSLFAKVLSILKIKYDINMVLLSFLFLLLIFPFDKFIPNNPMSSDSFSKILKTLMELGQSIFSIVFIYILYMTFKKKISNVVNIIMKENEDSDPTNNFINKIIYGSPFSCSLLFIIYFLIKIYFLFIRQPLILFYAIIILNIVYNGALYFIFLICYTMVYALNKISSLKEKQIKRVEEEVRIINSV